MAALSCSSRVSVRCLASPDQGSQEFASSAVATPSRTVSIFWDLDNKPPPLAPFAVAMRLKSAAAAFGCVRETIALANRHAFLHVPDWVREQRRERKILDILETTGRVTPPSPYQCDLCGRKLNTHLDLKRHFKQLHERERGKRIARLNQLSGKRRARFQAAIAAKEERYRAAASSGGAAALPRAGYGLAAELRRAGVAVRTVPDKPGAADEALKRRMESAMYGTAVGCVCLVSDDAGFGHLLRDARRSRIRTVVVGSTGCLRRFSDAWLSWDDVAAGIGQRDATLAARQWLAQDLLARELLEAEEGDGWRREGIDGEVIMECRSRVVDPRAYSYRSGVEEDPATFWDGSDGRADFQV